MINIPQMSFSISFASVETVNKLCSCKVCCHCTADFKSFYAHVKSHQNMANYRFQCGIEQCPSNFRTFSVLTSYMHRNHIPSVSYKQNMYQRSGNHKCSVVMWEVIMWLIIFPCWVYIYDYIYEMARKSFVLLRDAQNTLEWGHPVPHTYLENTGSQL